MKTKYRNVAFLVELMINILVFSISCAVLVGLFGKAGQISRHSREEAFANTQAQTLLETAALRGAGAFAGAKWLDGESLNCYYNSNWQQTDDENAPYVITLSIRRREMAAGVLTQLQAQAHTSAGRLLCNIHTANYQPAPQPVPQQG